MANVLCNFRNVFSSDVFLKFLHALIFLIPRNPKFFSLHDAIYLHSLLFSVVHCALHISFHSIPMWLVNCDLIYNIVRDLNCTQFTLILSEKFNVTITIITMSFTHKKRNRINSPNINVQCGNKWEVNLHHLITILHLFTS